MNSKFKNINKIPVLTYRWLNVNDVSIYGYSLPQISEFNNQIVDGVFQGNIEVINDKKMNLSQYDLEENLEFGVSKELVNLAENEKNRLMLIKAKKNEEVKDIIKIKYEFNEKNNTLVDYNIIDANENSKVTIILDYFSEDNSEGFHNGLTKIFARKNSTVDIITIQRLNNRVYNFNSTVANIEKDAKVNFINVELGGKCTVTNYKSNLAEDNSRADLSSIYVGDKDRTIDINYLTVHNAKRTESKMTVKGVLKDTSKKTFRGTIDFKKGSSKSRGEEEEFVILLDKAVKSNAVPLLLCEEDDVIGSHAASSGKIDENKLFYLMSRGFSEKEAKKLIIEASFNPILDKINDEEIKASIREDIQRRLLND